MAAVRAAGRRKFERGQRRREAEQANCTVKGDKKVEEPTKPTEKPKPDQKSKSEDYGQDQGF